MIEAAVAPTPTQSRSVAQTWRPVPPPRLLDRLRTLEEENARLRRELRQDNSQTATPEGTTKNGTVIVVASPKGGVGKSVIAAHLATGLAQFHKQRTVLVDANLDCGDQAVLFNLKDQNTIAELTGAESVDDGAAERMLAHHASGLEIVASPAHPLNAEKISSAVVVDLVRIYQSKFDFIVVDTRTGLGDLNLRLFDAADRILLIAAPEMNTAVHTARFLLLARTLGYADKIELVLNRANAGIRTDALSGYLGTPVAHRIVSAASPLLKACNAGEPLFRRDPSARDRITRDLLDLVTSIAEGQPSRGCLTDESQAESSAPSATRFRWPVPRALRLIGGGIAAAGLTAMITAGLGLGRGAQDGAVLSSAPVSIAAPLPASTGGNAPGVQSVTLLPAISDTRTQSLAVSAAQAQEAEGATSTTGS